jgi:uracil-DNA glycosylase
VDAISTSGRRRWCLDHSAGNRAVKPAVVVCLGATAAQALLGAQFKLTKQRGQVLPGALAERVVATIHPSAVLRAPDSEARRAAYESLVADLTVAAKVAKEVRR